MPNGAIAVRCSDDRRRDAVEAERAVELEPRPQVVGAEPVEGVGVDRAPELVDVGGLELQAGRLLVAAEARAASARTTRARASMSKPGMLRHEPWATPSSIDSTIVGR